MIAHVGAVPLEELVPVLAGASSGLLAVRAWIVVYVRRSREPRCTSTRGCLDLETSR